MLATLFGVSVYLIPVLIERIQLLRDEFPFVARLSVFSNYKAHYFSSSMRIFSSSYDQLCKVILCRFRLSHLNKHESAVVPGISELINLQLSSSLCRSATPTCYFSQYLPISQINILRSQTLQLRFNLRVLIILHQRIEYFSIRFSV